PTKAFEHEGRALSLRNELLGLRAGKRTVKASAEEIGRIGPIGLIEKVPPPFPSQAEPARIITVVSGLPRSRTSLMMQLLAAAGRHALTDSKRAADQDNPLGYFEFEKAINLTNDASWLSEARGKVVKIVAQLLPWLPLEEYYQIIFMQRDLQEVIASQKA